MKTCSKEDLVSVGFKEEDAEMYMSLDVWIRAIRIPIMGNGFSDLPFFQMVHEIMYSDKYSEMEKYAILMKNAYAVGSPYPLDAKPSEIIKEFMEICSRS